jgi:hypothetical protein
MVAWLGDGFTAAMNQSTIIKIAISSIAAALIIAHIGWPDLKIDSITIGLVVVAVLPWLASVIERATFPGGWELVFREVKQTVEQQQEQLEDQARAIAEQQKIINDLVVFSMAWFLFGHLKSIYYAQKTGGEYIFHKNDDFVDDLLYLRDNGYIEIHGIRQLDHGVNLAEKVKLTPIGSYYVELREQRESEMKKHVENP